MINVENTPSKEYISLIKHFPLVRIRNQKHLDAALEMIDELLNRQDALDSYGHEYLLLLGDIVRHYEEQNTPVAKLPPVKLLKYLMKVNGLRQVDLAPLFSSKSNLSEILSGRRQISKENARRLANHFKLSPAAFLAH